MGGLQNGPSNNVAIFDIATNQWFSGPDMRFPRIRYVFFIYSNTKLVIFANHFFTILFCRFSVVVANGKIFVIGGRLGIAGNSTSSCEVLDVEESPNQWKNISSMRYPRFGCAAAVFNNQIIVSGGYDGSYGHVTTRTSTEIYDIENDSWTLAENMKIPRNGHQLVVIPRDNIEDSAAESVLKKYSNF